MTDDVRELINERLGEVEAAAKFSVVCERCGVKVARTVTNTTAATVMSGHEQLHRNADRATPTAPRGEEVSDPPAADEGAA